MISSHEKISMISLISSLSLKLYLNSLVYHRNIFGSSSKVFGNHRKSSDIFEHFQKSSGSVRESSSGLLSNFGKINILYSSCHWNIKFISSRHRVISSISSIYQYHNIFPKLWGQNCNMLKLLLPLNAKKRLNNCYYNIDRTLRALWFVKNLCFIRV